MSVLNTKALFATGGVFVGCMLSIIFLEKLVKADPGIGYLVTFSQFLFISIHGFIFTVKCGTVKPNIALYDYFLLVIMFFSGNLANNVAFNFNIPVPLHMIFRSGSLVANMIMGIIILKKKYTFVKYFSVGMITVGIALATVMSSGPVKCNDCGGLRNETVYTSTTAPEVDDFFFRWIIGISLLTFALFINARMGRFYFILVL